MAYPHQDLYAKCRETVERIRSLSSRENITEVIGLPLKSLPIGNFFITDPETRDVTYCDIVELHHVDDFVIRIGYIKNVAQKVRGIPKIHWQEIE